MYYISFQNLIQEYVVPSSITCVNSMEMSYIPIAKARGFTTHWINMSEGNYSVGSIPRGVLACFLPKSRDIQGKMPSPKVIRNAF